MRGVFSCPKIVGRCPVFRREFLLFADAVFLNAGRPTINNLKDLLKMDLTS